MTEVAIRSVLGPIASTVSVPGSRSITNRAMFAAAVAHGSSRLLGALVAEDTVVFAEGLRELGFDVTLAKEQSACFVNGSAGRVPSTRAAIWVQNAGTAARFLLALAATGRGEYTFDGTAQIRARPIGALVLALQKLGARITASDLDHLPLAMKASELRMEALGQVGNSVSSQFLSALMLAAPLCKGELSVETEGTVSRPFLTMTARVMSAFGVKVHEQGTSLRIPPKQKYIGCDYKIEADAATASYFFAAAALTGGRLCVSNLIREQCIHGDIGFLSVLEKMGCVVGSSEQGTILQGPSQLAGIEIDMSAISDTFMTLAAIAPFASSPVTIRGIGHTRRQESDRISAIKGNLEVLGASVSAGEDWLRIEPSRLRGGLVKGYGDHRIAMSLALIGLRAPGLVIAGAECVGKTCPTFFDLWAQL